MHVLFKQGADFLLENTVKCVKLIICINEH